MKHYIIVKFHDKAVFRNSLYEEIQNLFLKAEELEGVHRVTFYPSCTDFPNRYDLMIQLEMEPEALAVYDSSAMHAVWKRDYSRYVESKAIFDCM